jgi:hypothetical protein
VVTFQMVSASSMNICDALAAVSGIPSNNARIKAVVFSFSNPVVLVQFWIRIVWILDRKSMWDHVMVAKIYYLQTR